MRNVLIAHSSLLHCFNNHRYRGGYTKAQRREIERKLFDGTMLGLTTTNALELGINIGSLDATIHLGIPSSQSSLVMAKFF